MHGPGYSPVTVRLRVSIRLRVRVTIRLGLRVSD